MLNLEQQKKRYKKVATTKTKIHLYKILFLRFDQFLFNLIRHSFYMLIKITDLEKKS